MNTRIEVNPNMFAGEDPDLTPVRLAQFDTRPHIGDRIEVTQKDDDGPAFISTAEVRHILDGDTCIVEDVSTGKASTTNTRADIARSAEPPRGKHMPRATMRVCSQPGCPRIQPETRCQEHRREQDRYYKTTTPTKISQRTYTERQRRKTAVDTHRATFGEWCPGYGRPPHHLTAADGGLTADHIVSVHTGGINSPLQTLCRSCNGRKAAS